MKSFFKKLAFVMALAMVVSLAAPAAKSAFAATEFTYAEQETGVKVTTLNMKAGDKVDLKFVGVNDYKNYTLEWVSSDPTVATVDNKGIVTAIADKGQTTVELKVGDGTVYTSTPVKVVVGEVMNVVLGTAKDNTFAELTLELGKTVDLNFYGVTDWAAGKYECIWTSTDDKVATVDKNGVVTPVATGTAQISVAIVDKATGVALNVVPVTVTVPEEKASYTVTQVSDTVAKLTFSKDVTVTAADISLVRVYDGDIEVAWPIEEVKVDGSVVTIKPYVAFTDGDKYIVRVGAEDEGTAFTTTIGVVDQVVVSYKSMDKSGKAYTNGEDGEEILVYLSAKLYSNGVDVTNVYGTEDVVYTLLTENENVMIDEYAGEMSFYLPGIAATVVATYTYYDADDNEQTVKTPVTLISELAPKYAVTGVKAWTIVKDGQDKIDWNNTVHKLAAYDDAANGYHIVALITDNYGNTLVTDPDYADSNAKIYAIEGSKFDSEGYYVEFSSANPEKMLVGTDGSLTTYTTASVPAIISLHNVNSERENAFVRNLSALPVAVQAQRTISKVTLDDTSLTLITDGAFTDGSVNVKVYDQYGDLWTEDVTLAVNASVDAVQNAGLYSTVTYVAANGKGVFTLDGADIKGVTDKTAVSFTVKESGSGKTATLKVALKNPRYEDDKVTIDVTSYSLAATDVDQYIKEEAKGTTKAATVSFYQLSNSYKVGIETDVTLVTDKDQLALTTADTAKGDKYIVVYAPNGSIVAAGDDDTLGVVANANGTYSVNVAVANGDTMKYAATGNYTVKVLEVSSFNKKDEAVFRTKYSANFNVTNTNKAVAFKKQAKLESEETDIKAIVKDAIAFTLGGSDWDYRVEDIVSVTYRYNEKAGYVVITSVKFNVPLNGSDDTVGYEKTVAVNKSVKVSGVTE